MRRQHLPTVVASALTAVALTAAPAWAAPSFTSGGQAEAGDPGHTVTMQVPDTEATGPTTEVRLTAPAGFVPSSCVQPVGWSCSVGGQQVTWTRGDALAQLGTFGFQTAVATTPGTYSFPVRQTGTAGSATWAAGSGAPTMTVTGPGPTDDGGEEQGPSEAPSSESDAGSGDGSDEAEEEVAPPTPATPDPSSTPADGDEATASGDEPPDEDTRGTAPTRTEGRTSGTTLEVTPGTTGATGAAEPAVAAPDVADEPAAAPATATTASDTAAAGAALETTAARSRPWQQLLGAALLALGGLLVGVRQWLTHR